MFYKDKEGTEPMLLFTAIAYYNKLMVELCLFIPGKLLLAWLRYPDVSPWTKLFC